MSVAERRRVPES